ncbi:TlyA family RNA methyltransferase [Candidatus Cyanaurora vandensis]|uniref:TlyA family RNA methyltransferase n=1 Tax=Candidatus Cyanaurora vandensis TaxID=2714958 RepID=UPI0025798F76|nr:TlyA family RNA methyltransferase [Candidatus Cyanaurora vandensis]
MPQRLDQSLVERGLSPSRHQAQLLIRAGQVRVNGELTDKPSTPVDPAAEIIIKVAPRFVSRGGEKLLGALQVFQPLLAGRVCLDGGVSTGGFTDCLLQQGASRVYGVDVGYGQVAWTLRTDPRVILKERTNLRYLTADQLYPAGDPRADLAVVDLSFISLTKIFPALWDLLVEPRASLLLVKPQFECGRAEVGRGVVRDPQIHQAVLTKIIQAAEQQGWQTQGLTWSPLTGPEGNIEYWLWLGTQAQPVEPKVVVQAAHAHFKA